MSERKSWVYLSNAILFVSLLAAIIAVVLSITSYKPNEDFEQKSIIHEINDGWVYIDENGQYQEFLTFGEKLRTRDITLSRIFIFDNEGDLDALNFLVKDCAVEIFQNGYQIGAYGDVEAAQRGEMIGEYEVSQKLEVYPGEAAEIIVHFVSSLPYTIIGTFSFGSRSSISANAFMLSLPSVVFAVASIVMAIVVVIIMSVGRRRGLALWSYYYFLAFLICAVMWMLSSSNVWDSLGFGSKILSMLSYESFMVMPIAFSLFMYYSFKKFRILDMVSMYVAFVVLVALNILHFTDVAIFPKTVYISIGVMVTSSLLALIQAIVEFAVARMRYSFSMMVSTGILFLGMLSQWILTATGTAQRFSWGILVSMIVFVFAQSIILIMDLFRLVDEGRKAGDYLYMAKTDSLTGLENRRGLELYIKEIADTSAPFFRIGCIVCDLNGLKKTNDTYGHAVGDQMLKDFANCLKICFENRGIPFRSGGDEFYILFSDVEVDMSAMMRRLMIGIEGSNTCVEYKLSCSSGCYADYVPSHNEGAIWDIIKLADAEMYKQKKKDRAQAAAQG